jgi:hypothetical protein
MRESGFMTWEEEEDGYKMSENEERKALKKMAEHWLLRYQEIHDTHITHTYIHSISQIDGVTCNASWRLHVSKCNKTPTLRIEINSVTLIDENCNPAELFQGTYGVSDMEKYTDEVIVNGITVDMLADMIGKAIVSIKELRYDRIYGLTNRKVPSNVECEEAVFNLPNITNKKIQACSVCHELTKHKTECGHHLCWQCWSKLKITEDHDECCSDSTYQVCPICREIMSVHDYA